MNDIKLEINVICKLKAEGLFVRHFNNKVCVILPNFPVPLSSSEVHRFQIKFIKDINLVFLVYNLLRNYCVYDLEQRNFLLQVITEEMLKILKNDETIIFRTKGYNTANIKNDKFKYISPLTVFKGSKCGKVSLTYSEN